MIKKIKENVWKLSFINFGSCVYLLKLDKKNILIDTGSESNRDEFLNALKELGVKASEINVVILTHNHYDHTGNIEIFKNAEIYGSKEDFKAKRIFNSSLNKVKKEEYEECEKNGICRVFTEKEIKDIDNLKIKGLKIVKTPGHTKGSICIFLPEEKILFSGDTLFHNGIGRTDFPNSSPEEMEKSLEKLEKINYEILCPGHD